MRFPALRQAAGRTTAMLRSLIHGAPGRRAPVRDLAWMAAFAVLYFAAGKLGLTLAYLHPSASPVWPPSGLALATILLLGRRVWPAIFVGAFMVNITTAGSVATSLGIATGNTLEPLLGAYLVNRFAGGRRVFDQPRGALGLVVLAAILSPTASATMGVTSLALGGYAPWPEFWRIWVTWWLGDAVSVLVATPFLVLWYEDHEVQRLKNAGAELALVLIGLLFLGRVIFFAQPGAGNLPIIYLCILPILWAVFRFGPREAAAALLLLSGLAIWGTQQGFGPFVRATPNESLFLLQAFLGVTALKTIMVGAVITQRRKAEARLKETHSELEKKVEAGSREISGATAGLRESEERFRSFLESAPDAMVIVTREGEIVLVNAQTERLFGYTRQELLGNRMEMLVPGRFLGHDPDGRDDFLENHRVRPMGDGPELFGLRKDHSRFPVDISLSRLEMQKRILVSVAIRDITRRKRGEESMARLAAIVESSEDAIFSFTLDGLMTSWNGAAERLSGYSSSEVLGRPITLLVPPGQQAEAALDLERLKRGERIRSEAKRRRKDGTLIDVWLTSFPVMDAAGRIVGFSTILRDIAEQRRAQQERQEKEILRALVDELSRRTNEISVLNELGEVLRSALSLAEACPVIPRFIRELFPSESGALYVSNDGHNLLEGVVSWGASPPIADAFLPHECWALRRGQMHQAESSASELACQHWKPPISASSTCIPLTARGRTFGLLHILGVAHDTSWTAGKGTVGEYKQRLAKTVAQQISSALFDLKLQETLRFEASRDPLTGLFNRRYMEESLSRELYRAARKSTSVGFILLDLDRFKTFNDRYGHAAGDAALRALSAYVQERSRSEDILCRYGGEEFLLMLSDCSLSDLVRRAEELREGAKQLHLEYDGRSLGGITLSAGVALFPDHGKTPRELFQAADAALYAAKRVGSDRVMVAESAGWIADPDRALQTKAKR